MIEVDQVERYIDIITFTRPINHPLYFAFYLMIVSWSTESGPVKVD